MKTETFTALNAYTQAIAELNGVSTEQITHGQEFNVKPSVRQTLENAVQLKSDFLGKINIIPVSEMTGEALQLGVSSPIAGRVDTNTTDRTGINFTALKKQTYVCQRTYFDTAITYDQLDVWAKFPDFAHRIADQKTKRIALDRIMIGFNGKTAEKVTNRESNPTLSDVNIGWLEQIRKNATTNVLDAAKVCSKKLAKTIKRELAENEYLTLDSLVNEARHTVIAEEYRDDTDLVVILGSELMYQYHSQFLEELAPSEKIAGDVVTANKRIGGLKAVTVPYFPKNALLITRLDNLSIYYQDTATRRKWLDDVKRDRYLDLFSSNEAYVVENLEAVALVENITQITEE